MKKTPIILDTDIGTDVDDTWALAQLLNSPELDCRLILTTGGDTLYRAHIAAKMLQTARRQDIPLGLGVRGEGYGLFQKPWLEDFDVDSYGGEIDPDGVERAVSLMEKCPELVYISIGPATNAALVAEKLGKKLKTHKFVGMHGSVYKGYDDSPEVAAEANVKADPRAFQALLSAAWKEIVLTPLDSCGVVVLRGEPYRRVAQSNRPLAAAVMENYRIWAGLVDWMHVSPEDVATHSSTLFDTVAVYLAYAEELLTMETVKLQADGEGYTRPCEEGVSVRVATGWRDLSAFYDHLVERLLK